MASKKLTAKQQQLFDALTPLQKKFSLAIITLKARIRPTHTRLQRGKQQMMPGS